MALARMGLCSPSALVAAIKAGKTLPGSGYHSCAHLLGSFCLPRVTCSLDQPQGTSSPP